MKALVTGATGFIGSFLTKKLIATRHGVRALVLPAENASCLEDAGMEIFRGDLTKPESLRGICDGVDVVFHLAGRVTDWGTRKQFYTAIYNATGNLLEEASGKATRFVYISSIAALGFGRHLKGAVETDPGRLSGVPYNDAKTETETLVRRYHTEGKIRCTIVRPANVIGPGSVWVRDILDKMKLALPLIDGGRYSGSFVYVENLVDGIILAATREIAAGKTYHLRDDWHVTWRRYLTDLGVCAGRKPRGNIPFAIAWPIARLFDAICTPLSIRPPVSRLGVAVLGRDNDVDTSLAREDLGWATRVPYGDAIKAITAWVKEKHI